MFDSASSKRLSACKAELQIPVSGGHIRIEFDRFVDQHNALFRPASLKCNYAQQMQRLESGGSNYKIDR